MQRVFELEKSGFRAVCDFNEFEYRLTVEGENDCGKVFERIAVKSTIPGDSDLMRLCMEKIADEIIDHKASQKIIMLADFDIKH